MAWSGARSTPTWKVDVGMRICTEAVHSKAAQPCLSEARKQSMAAGIGADGVPYSEKPHSVRLPIPGPLCQPERLPGA